MIAAGAKVLIVITHKGLLGYRNNGTEPYGELIDFARGVNGFDIIFGDHTDVPYKSLPTINGAVVVENSSSGVQFARIRLFVDPVTGAQLQPADVKQFVTNATSIVPDAAAAAYVADLQAQLILKVGIVIANSTVPILQKDVCGTGNGRTCDSAAGEVVADAMRITYGTDFALQNSGGVRAPITCTSGVGTCPVFAAGSPIPITKGQLLAVLPFNNIAVTLPINGAELLALLENAVSLMPAGSGRFMQPSGLCFTYNLDKPSGSRIVSAVRQDAQTGACTGAAVSFDASASYTIVLNDFQVCIV